MIGIRELPLFDSSVCCPLSESRKNRTKHMPKRIHMLDKEQKDMPSNNNHKRYREARDGMSASL
jgi:uncharacterized Zn-finger protein